jgi:hypothetical protein
MRQNSALAMVVCITLRCVNAGEILQRLAGAKVQH